MYINPSQMASQLVYYERMNTQDLISRQQKELKSEREAINSLTTKLESFQKSLKDLNKASELQAQSATPSQEGFMNVTSDGSASTGQYSFFVKQLAQAHQVGMVMDSEDALLPTDGVFSLEVGGEKLDIDLSTMPAGSTVKDLVTHINTAEGNPGVKASLVRTNGEVNLVLTSQETGVENAVNMSYSGDPSNMLGAAIAGKTDITTAKDAIIEMGGDNPIVITSASNKVEGVVDGLTIELTKAQEPGEAPIQLTVGQDQEKVTGAVKSFVEGYNSLMNDINSMTKSGSGALSSDSGIRSLKSQLRNMVRDLPEGMSLASLGIETDRDGKLKFDQTEFEKSLEKDPELLGKAFMGEDGLLNSMQDALKPYTDRDGLLKSRTEGFEAREKRLDNKMDALNRRSESSYNRYLRQYTMMNQMMSSMGMI
ncbi:MAG: flagellar filament capping protein FliD [Shewanella sp.]|uniref:flagellar filament capping protein FliD n=1 Tax=Shewanella sp. TaxID=50422 RepID=UPI003F2AC189